MSKTAKQLIEEQDTVVPDGGTLTAEQYRKFRAATDGKHIVIHQMHAPGVVT